MQIKNLNRDHSPELLGIDLDVKIYKKEDTFKDSELFGIKLPKFIIGSIAGIIIFRVIKRIIK